MNENFDPCPACGGELRYLIGKDAYVCRACCKEYETISVERDHILFNGGPPEEVKPEEDQPR